ncbi:unnamed protein product [Miscanthus lutarioriparius]|uniref:Uncharacterized protein n=1 Tax=Miscanthus lutarioriparius TaxID=422564 RepID=A0A811P6X3_9POAL|nr:unnamed protein product [Miscanthus lutarioriparius]
MEMPERRRRGLHRESRSSRPRRLHIGAPKFRPSQAYGYSCCAVGQSGQDVAPLRPSSRNHDELLPSSARNPKRDELLHPSSRNPMIMDLSFSLYSTFVIEAQHGFNKVYTFVETLLQRWSYCFEGCQITDMCLDLYKEFGTTMAGLKVFTNYDKAHVEEALWGLLGKGMDMAESSCYSIYGSISGC